MKPALKIGQRRFYFPEFPNHPYNGCFAHWTGAYVPETQYHGRPVRLKIGTFENTEHNLSVWSGLWKDEIYITADDFQTDRVLVKLWDATNEEPEVEEFYLEAI